MVFIFRLNSEEDTRYLGKILSYIVIQGDLITLQGDLGSGKSVLIRSTIQTLLQQKVTVPSPTFNLLQIYDYQNIIITHADLYRIKNFQEVEDLGLNDLRNEGILFIEWPNFSKKILENPELEIFMQDTDKERFAIIKIKDKIKKRLRFISNIFNSFKIIL